MTVVKKLLFAPLFLGALAFSYIQILPFLNNSSLIFSLDISTLGSLIYLSLGVIFSGFFYCLLAGLSQDLKVVMPIALLGGVIAVILVAGSSGIVLGILVASVCLLAFLTLKQSLKSYLNFSPLHLFMPSIKNFSKMLILVVSLSLFLQFSSLHQSFQIPDSLIDTALKFAPSQDQGVSPKQAPTLPNLSPEQISLLKQNPALLKQYGLDPSILDQLSSPQLQAKLSPTSNPETNLIKETIKAQISSMISPYQSYIPAILALLFFITLTSFVSLLSLLLYLLIPATFWILEETGFLTFQEEQRTVKKMLV